MGCSARPQKLNAAAPKLSQSPRKTPSGRVPAADEPRPLYAPVSRPLLSFALELERGFPPSLAICANIQRARGPDRPDARSSRPVRRIERSHQHGDGRPPPGHLAVVEKRSGDEPWLETFLTPKGRKAWEAFLLRQAELEQEWDQRYGTALLSSLRECLRGLGAGSALPDSPSRECLGPLRRAGEPLCRALRCCPTSPCPPWRLSGRPLARVSLCVFLESTRPRAHPTISCCNK